MAGPGARHDDGAMTANPDEQAKPVEQQCHGLDGFFGWVRGLGVQRNTDDKWVAGVCSGLASRLGVDPLLVRGAMLMLIIFGGFGLTVYLVAWALLPDRNDHIVAEGGIRHGEGWGIALLVVIAVVVFSDLADRWWIWTIILPTVLLAWGVRSTKAGKTPEQMGEEASQLANTVASTVESWGATQGRHGGHRGCSSRSSAATSAASYAGSSPQEAAPASPSTPDHVGPGAAHVGQGAATPHGMGPGRTGAVTPPAPRVVQKRRRRAGILGLLLTVGLALAAYGAGTQVAPDLSSTASPEIFGLAAALAAAGLALVLIGLTGRRAGFAGFLAAALAVVTVLSTTSPPEFVRGGIGERSWSLTQSSPAPAFRLGVGEATLNLAGATDGSTVEASVGMGQLVIKVPAGAKVTVNPELSAGEITVTKPDGTKQSYDARDDSLPGSLQVGTGATTITVNARVGMGEITIEES